MLQFSELSRTIELFDPSTIVPFPQLDAGRFRDLLDDEMGFV